MKKLVYFLILLLIPFGVKAYGIDTYRIDATVLENGDLHIYESFNLTGSFNGMERIINYRSDYIGQHQNSISPTGNSTIYDGTGIELKAIKGVNFSKTDSLPSLTGDIFKPVGSADKGDYGVYTISKSDYGENYLIYNPNRKNKAFYLEYILKDMVITHNDIAELGYNIFTKMNESIGYLELYIHVPNNESLLRIWGHGPLYGETKIVDKNTVKVVISGLDANTAIDARLVFDKGIVTTKKNTNIDALDKIIKIETELADKANEEREQQYEIQKQLTLDSVAKAEETLNRNDYEIAYRYVNQLKVEDSVLKEELLKRLEKVLVKVEQKEKTNKIITYTTSSLYLAGLIFLLIYNYQKFDKEHKPEFNNEYFRDFPENYPPTTVGYLIRKKVNSDDLSASILDLIRKKIITYEPVDEKNKDFFFKKGTEKPSNTADDYLLKFIFEYDTIDTVKMSEMKKRANSDYDTFISLHSDWNNKVTCDAKAEGFYESSQTLRRLSQLYAFLGILVPLVIFQKHATVSVLLALISVIALIYFSSYVKKSVKGSEQYVKWMALKKYMEDFGTMDEKELPDINLWEKYLVYAVTLGCSKKLAKTMKIKIEALEQQGMIRPDIIDIYYFNRILLLNQSLNTVMASSIQSAYNARTAASSSSSGSGFGGGFSGGSSGGGSFGGGGGGGRF